MTPTMLFTAVSGNKKTGPIPVSGSQENTCPVACPFRKNGCYAAYGPISWHWRKLNKGKIGFTWAEFIKKIRQLPRKTLWRHNQFGDLAGASNRIDRDKLNELIAANKGRKGFTYTHKPVLQRQSKFAGENCQAVAIANREGFVVNLSGNNLGHADELKALGIGPVVTIVPSDTPNTFFTPNGHKGIVCPAQQREGVSCASCKLCSVATHSVIIGFKAHGVGAKHVENQT